MNQPDENSATFEESELAATLAEGDRQETRAAVLPLTTKVGNYELLQEIGRGGMGVVYKARQLSLNRIVAVKMILSGEFAGEVANRRFQNEAESAARLKHSRIVPVYEISEDCGRQFFSMEFVEGTNLHEKLRSGPLPARQAAQLILEIAEAVQYAHTMGIIHRDLKPGNILLDASGHPRVTDFGIARYGAANKLTVTGEILGTPGFIPPEQVRCLEDQIGPASDVYSLGALLYATLTGHPPFRSPSQLEVLRQVIEELPVEPRVINPDVPLDLETICLKCLEKNPARRFATATEMGLELTRYLNGIPIRSRPIRRIEKVARWCRRNPALSGTVGVAVASVFAIVCLLWTHNRELERLNQDLQESTSVAQKMQTRAEENARQVRDALYAANIAQGAEVWRQDDPRGLKQILMRQIPRAGEADRRGFEWRYLYQHVEQKSRVLLNVKSPQYVLSPVPDERQLAVAGNDAIVRLINADSGELVQEIVTGQVEVNGVAFSPDGREMVTSGDDGTVRVWDLQRGKERLKIDPRAGKMFQVVFSPDGEHLIFSGDDPEIRVVDAHTGEDFCRLVGHRKSVNNLSLVPNTQTLMSSSDDSTVRVWDCSTWKETFALPTSGQSRPLIPMNDRGLLIIGTDLGHLHSFDLKTRTHHAAVKHPDGIESLAVHPDGTIVAAGDRGGSIRLWKLGTDGALTESMMKPWAAHEGIVYSLAWSPDGSQLISAGNDGRILSWNLSRTRQLGPRRIRMTERPSSATRTFYLNPHTDQVIVCEAKAIPEVSLWNWRTGQKIESRKTFDNAELGIAPHGDYFAVATRDHRLQIYQTQPGFQALPQPPCMAQWNAPATLRAPLFFPDGRRIAVTTGTTGSVADSIGHFTALLDLPDLKLTERIPVDEPGETVISPDGTSLAIANQAGLSLWNVVDRKFHWRIAQSNLIKRIAFSPDGKLVATGGDERFVTVRNVRDGSVRYELSNHRSRIRSITFSADGKTLATASDGVLTLSHVPTGYDLLEIAIPGTTSSSQAMFTPDSNHLLWGVENAERIDELLVFDAENEEE